MSITPSAIMRQITHRLHDDAPGLEIERGCGLVGKNHLRIARQRPSESHHPD